MKQKLTLLLAGLCLAFGSAGCQGEPEAPAAPWPDTAEVSNLNDPETRALAARLLEYTSSEAQQEVFFDHVDQINGFLEPDELTDGFQRVGITQPKYDAYELQARWEQEYPDFLGYNCRITAFSLFRDLIRLQPDAQADTNDIVMDLFALEEDPAALPGPEELAAFQTLYAGVETENTKDVTVHLAHMQEAWAERGVTFQDSDASLISVVFHDQLDGDSLFIGHTGILYEMGEDSFYFLEKLSFQEPYQLVRLSSRAELSDYLMVKYDVDVGQSMAPPFVMENDHMLQGYRPRSAEEKS